MVIHRYLVWPLLHFGRNGLLIPLCTHDHCLHCISELERYFFQWRNLVSAHEYICLYGRKILVASVRIYPKCENNYPVHSVLWTTCSVYIREKFNHSFKSQFQRSVEMEDVENRWFWSWTNAASPLQLFYGRPHSHWLNTPSLNFFMLTVSFLQGLSTCKQLQCSLDAVACSSHLSL